ncbi:MAG: ChaN family lipoprotein [Magnetococcales bacterium]|nr:ChaN family lipoprotein [Magnetococcales bacterium]
MIFLPLFLGLALLQWGFMGTIPLEVNEILRLADRESLTETGLIDHLSGHRIVLIGEAHDNPAHHAVQLKVIQALHARQPDMALALEMFPRTMQPHLDRWVAGELEEAAFLDAVEWYFTWGFEAELYLPILRFARDQRIPVLAMNLPRATVSQVRKQGMSELATEIRDTLPPICPATLDYRMMLEEIFNGHPMISKSGKFDHFVESQTLWDGVMADTIRRWSNEHPKSVVVGLAGAGHLLMGYGIPHQLRSRGMEDLVTLLPWTSGDSWIDPLAADYAWGTSETPETPPPASLGVILDDQRPDGAWIKGTQEGSRAAKAELKAGDRIVRLNDQQVSSRHALVRLVHGVPHGATVRLRLERAGEAQEIELPAAQHGHH